MSPDDLETRLDALRDRAPLTAHGREAALRRAARAAGHAHEGPENRGRTGTPAARAGAPGWARWRLSWRAAGAGALALALVAGAVVLRTAAATPGPPVELAQPSPPAAVGGAPGAGPSADGGTPSAAPPLLVHVAGAVREPGVVRLPAGARVVDAIEAAGGARGSADLAALNLARPVVDGEQVLVVREGEQAPPPPASSSGPAGAGAGAGASVDLNTADVPALDALPGIGPVLAQRIVEQRASHPFASVDELVEVPGIGPALLERLRPRVRV